MIDLLWILFVAGLVGILAFWMFKAYRRGYKRGYEDGWDDHMESLKPIEPGGVFEVRNAKLFGRLFRKTKGE